MSLLEQYESTFKNKTLLERYEEKLKLNPSLSKKSHALLERVQNTHKKPVLNEDAFILFTATHRLHQLKAIKSTFGNDREQIILPTGIGKTRVQIHIHVQDMIEKIRKNETGVFVIAAHRLLLCTQLMDELQHLCIECGLPINALYIGSARHDDKLVYEKYFHKGIDSETFSSTYTTKTDEILKFYEETKEAKRHLIIVSTYHSFDKMSCIDNIDICTYDGPILSLFFAETVTYCVKCYVYENKGDLIVEGELQGEEWENAREWDYNFSQCIKCKKHVFTGEELWTILKKKIKNKAHATLKDIKADFSLRNW